MAVGNRNVKTGSSVKAARRIRASSARSAPVARLTADPVSSTMRGTMAPPAPQPEAAVTAPLPTPRGGSHR
jgi:hypothetical protein